LRTSLTNNYGLKGAKTTAALWPPKPNEFEIAGKKSSKHVKREIRKQRKDN
jgi:hypothetical protein